MSLPEENQDMGPDENEQPEQTPAGEAEVVDDYKDKYLRILAEFDYMRKRGERERAQAR